MSRNKYPEQTIHRILEIAGKLFLEKGYDNTSIQDIVDRLGMSKGAIYHHFKSKQEILKRLCIDYYNNMDWFHNIARDSSLNGREKLRRVLLYSLHNESKLQIDTLFLPLLENPQIIAFQLQDTVLESPPYMVQLIEEGNADGSLRVEHPQETAEIVMLLGNIWINPGVFCWTESELSSRFTYLQQLFEKMGLPILDEEVRAAALRYFHALAAPQPECDDAGRAGTC